MKRNRIEFQYGPYDGWTVVDSPDFRKHYYIPIENEKFHHYERDGDIYAYQGEVVVVS